MTPADSPTLHDLVAALADVEERLARILVSGWRNALAEARDLTAIADAIAAANLTETAGRIRAVAGADGAEDGLRAVALASTACRLTRAQLAEDLTPQGRWRSLDGTRSPSSDRVIPLARYGLEGGEVWSCLRLRGAFSAEWVLLEPPVGVTPGWLRRPLQGRLRWQRRHPLGDAGEVQECRLDFAEPAPAFPAGQDPLEPFRAALTAGRLGEDSWVMGGSGVFRARAIDTTAFGDYAWPDSSLPDALGQFTADGGWALVCLQGEVATPIGLFTVLRRAREIRIHHLVPGFPADV